MRKLLWVPLTAVWFVQTAFMLTAMVLNAAAVWLEKYRRFLGSRAVA